MGRYVVTGGAGFIGSHLVDRLLSEGHHPVVLDNFLTGTKRNLAHLEKETRLEVVDVDVSEKFPNVGAVDGVLHLASPASPVDFDPHAVLILKTGSIGTLHGLEYAARHHAWFLMASTSEIYGDPTEHPQTERYWGNVNTIGPRAPYDEAKRFSEALTMAFHRKKKLRTSIVRIFNTYGPRMRGDDGRVIPNFIMQALRGEPLTIYGDGLQTRSLCYVDDLVDGLMRFVEKQPVEPINLGNGREVTVEAIAQTILRGTASESGTVKQPLPEDDPKQRCPDITRAREILGWAPTTSFEEGLRPTIDYFRKVLL